MAWILRFIDQHFRWLNPVLVMLTTVTGAFLTYSIPPDVAKMYPVRTALLANVLGLLPVAFPVLAVVLVLVTWVRSRSEKTLVKLEKDNLELKSQMTVLSENIKNVFEGFLYRFATTKLAFGGEAENTERITLYIYDDADNRFVSFGRYSANPGYKTAGRPEYPISQGCIAKGWAHGWHFDNQFAQGKAARADRHLADYSIPKKVANALSMPSRLYAAMRIKDAGGRPIAVMVVESTKNDRWDEAQLKTAMQSQDVYLAEMITRLKDYIPKPSSAGSRGL